MVTILEHGITALTVDNAEGAIVQSAEVTDKVEEANVSGMVDGVTQVVKTFTHTSTKDFSVTGKGDLTLVPGTASTLSTFHAGSLMSGGKMTIKEFKYSQKIGEPSEWSYSGTHYPAAA